MTDKTSRREFLKNHGALGLGAVLAGTGLAEDAAASPTRTAPLEKVRVGIVGVGGRGNSLLGNLLQMKSDVEVRAVCDIHRSRAEGARARVAQAGSPKPEAYFGDEYVWKKFMDRDDLDAVIVATYWEWHTPMAVYAMKTGKYVGVEVPAAYTLEECWELVNTYEQTGVPCMMLENWSFRSDNLAVLNMIRMGLLGEIMHCHCAHSHDCIDHWFFDRQTGKDRWPAKYLVEHNRDQYPTHQLGPVISWMDINRGDAFDYVTATAEKFGPDHPNARRKFAQGDIVTTVVRTKKGKSIVINYDMQLPRPYDNRWLIQGTRGLYNEQREAVYLNCPGPTTIAGSSRARAGCTTSSARPCTSRAGARNTISGSRSLRTTSSTATPGRKSPPSAVTAARTCASCGSSSTPSRTRRRPRSVHRPGQRARESPGLHERQMANEKALLRPRHESIAACRDGWQRQGRRPWRWFGPNGEKGHRQAAFDAATRCS